MKRISDYFLVQNSDLVYFIARVKDYLNDGWELHGDPIVKGDCVYDYFQAVVKYESVEQLDDN